MEDTYNIAYIIHSLLGAGNLVSWNSFITAVDYFEYVYPNKHIDKVFSVAYMGSSLVVLVLLTCCSSFSKLPGFKMRMNLGQALFILALMMAPVTDWAFCGNKAQQKPPQTAYVVLILALVVCGFADGLTAGSLIGATGELPGRYMQAVFAGNASSAILVCILRIVTKASLPHTPKGLRTSTHIYFFISIFIVALCMICCNLLDELPIIQHYHQNRTTAPKSTVPGETHDSVTNQLSNPANPTQRPIFYYVVKKIQWPALGIFIIYIVTLSIFPGYFSENVESKYFRDWYPILLITTYNVADFMGKSLTAIYVPKNTGRAIWACVMRLLFYPMFTACLHGPKWLRSEFPVVFLTGVLGITNGYLTSVFMILAPKLVPVEESETVGIVMVLFLVIGLAVGSVIGWLWNI